jgi:hypothetical protein
VTAIGQAGDGDASFYGKLRNELLNGEILYTLHLSAAIHEWGEIT